MRAPLWLGKTGPPKLYHFKKNRNVNSYISNGSKDELSEYIVQPNALIFTNTILCKHIWRSEWTHRNTPNLHRDKLFTWKQTNNSIVFRQFIHALCK